MRFMRKVNVVSNLNLKLRCNVGWTCLNSEYYESERDKQEVSAGSVKRSKRRTNTKNTSTENRLWNC